MRTLLLLLIAATLAPACGNASDRETGPDTDAQAYSTMRASTEFQQAYENMKSCMLDAGYPEIDSRKGIVLTDGSIIRADSGQRLYLTGAYLEYSLASERCEQTSGIARITSQFHLASPTLDPAVEKRLNENTTREMACMKQKGWAIPEPVTSRGILIFDVSLDSDEERSAYNVDYYACMAQLGTGQPLK
jgi:hypothetical protein